MAKKYKKKDNGKNDTGRPPKSVSERVKEITFDLDKIREIAKYGLTDVQLADVLGVSESTIHRWKKESNEFLEVLNKGKLESDFKMVDSLYRRGLGTVVKEEKSYIKYITNKDGNREGVPQYTIVTKKEIPPDTAASFIWLKNRLPSNWRDKQEINHSVISEVKIIDDIE